ncbi:hypothetical protein ABH909_002979 [Pseudomonas sp. BS3782 TE3695]|uniref:hypothetical protein n=1 Tax=Pseudomonas sp. BS3782 TE3695 TaxID=3349323 RepID=UPI003D22E2D2
MNERKGNEANSAANASVGIQTNDLRHKPTFNAWHPAAERQRNVDIALNGTTTPWANPIIALYD